MALPWLIGAAALYAAKKLGDKFMDDDDDDDSYDYERASRRREEAEHERAENERKKKLETAHENFATRGESIGLDIAHSLKGWIEVNFKNSPAFSAKLNPKGYKTEHAIQNEQEICSLLPGSQQFDEIREKLKNYSAIYKVRMEKGAKLVEAGEEIETIESELGQIGKLKAEISKLQSDLSARL